MNQPWDCTVGEKREEREKERERGEFPFRKGRGRSIKGIEKRIKRKGMCWRGFFTPSISFIDEKWKGKRRKGISWSCFKLQLSTLAPSMFQDAKLK